MNSLCAAPTDALNTEKSAIMIWFVDGTPKFYTLILTKRESFSVGRIDTLSYHRKVGISETGAAHGKFRAPIPLFSKDPTF
jgi:hypothetical protein